MQPGDQERIEETARLTLALTDLAEKTTGAVQAIVAQSQALTVGLVFLMAELESRGGLDRAALAEQMVDGARRMPGVSPGLEQALRDLCCQPAETACPVTRTREGPSAVFFQSDHSGQHP